MNDQKDRSAAEGSLTSSASAMRQLAEAIVHEGRASSLRPLNSLSIETIAQAIHELSVHQIELEMQNDELRRTQYALEAAQARFFDFYDLAPVGYVTVNEKALILQANLTTASLLGVPRADLIGKALPGFMAPPDADRYFLLCQQVLASATAQSLELRMLQSNGHAVWVSLQAIAVPGDEGTTVIRMVLSEITARKHLEERRYLVSALRSCWACASRTSPRPKIMN
jgi:PAS domain S-box-containing protein